ncbi:thioredoxin family protein [uncultured Sphaerochaeta sp.]|uniref:thioredoxin family protein n=1 Tax=uncultured Sphaerochaeta sp. TaxID=886478 RepID=UPI002A0A42EC|nr:thioredoxin family protein [uncultured Sphaerochaeta sp.]
MAIFGLGKKKKELETCTCGGNCGEQKESLVSEVEASVKVLGSGCAKCNALERNTIEALQELSMDTTIEHVTDFTKIAAFGVMTTPALVVDGKVLSMGKVLTKNEVVEMLKVARQ